MQCQKVLLYTLLINTKTNTMNRATEQLTANVQENKEITKRISKKLSHYSAEQFTKDAQAYILAIAEGRMLNVIKSVSSSGMSRTIKFTSCEKSSRDMSFWYRNYTCLFIALGYTEARNKDGYFTISGCGMDMIFHTNYSIVHDLCRLGFITDSECKTLAQKTPTTI